MTSQRNGETDIIPLVHIESSTVLQYRVPLIWGSSVAYMSKPHTPPFTPWALILLFDIYYSMFYYDARLIVWIVIVLFEGYVLENYQNSQGRLEEFFFFFV
jgi:hypothetical protein